MNVNILGKGLIPGLRMLAPIKNVDLDQQQIARILKVRTLKVTLADSPDLITPNNLAAMFAPKPVEKATKKKKDTAKQNTPAETLIEKAVDAGIEVAVEEKKEEEVVEETTTTPDEVLTELSSDITLGEGLVTDDGYSAATDETPSVEETTEEGIEEDKANTISKKNKKNRRNK